MVASLSAPRERRIHAPTLVQIVEMYLADREPHIDPKSMYNYRHALTPFLVWWQRKAEDHKQYLSKTTLRAYLHWMQTEYEPRTGYLIGQRLNLLGRFFRWAHANGCVKFDISDMVPDYEPDKNDKFYPKVHEIAALMATCSGIYKERNMALWGFLLSTGARRAEVAAACIENLHFNTPLRNLSLGDDHSGHIHFRSVKGDPKGKKGGRYSVFDSTCGLLLKIWLRQEGRKSGLIFELGDEGIRYVVNQCRVDAGIPLMHPHACRSMFISYWAMKHITDSSMLPETLSWANLALRLQVGHSLRNDDAQLKYIDMSPEYKVQLISQFHVSPLDEIQIDWESLPVHIP